MAERMDPPEGSEPEGAGMGKPWERLSPPYRTIVADPPWSYEGFVPSRTGSRLWHRPLPYSMLDLSSLKALPVGDLAEKDAHGWLWTTNRYLGEAFGVLSAWGFRYRQTIVWRKTGNPTPMGGSVAPNHAEYLLFARRGQLPIRLRGASSVIDAPKGLHSAKPQAFMDLIESASPGPYVELFARSPRLGWDSWGYGYEAAS